MLNWLKQNFFGRLYRYFSFLFFFTAVSSSKKSEKHSTSCCSSCKVLYGNNDSQELVFNYLLGCSRSFSYLKFQKYENSYYLRSEHSGLKDSYIQLFCVGVFGFHCPLFTSSLGKKLLSSCCIGSSIFSTPGVYELVNFFDLFVGEAGGIVLVPNFQQCVRNVKLALQIRKKKKYPVKLVIFSDFHKKLEIPEIDNEHEGSIGLLFYVKILGSKCAITKKPTSEEFDSICELSDILSQNICTFPFSEFFESEKSNYFLKPSEQYPSIIVLHHSSNYLMSFAHNGKVIKNLEKNYGFEIPRIYNMNVLLPPPKSGENSKSHENHLISVLQIPKDEKLKFEILRCLDDTTNHMFFPNTFYRYQETQNRSGFNTNIFSVREIEELEEQTKKEEYRSFSFIYEQEEYQKFQKFVLKLILLSFEILVKSENELNDLDYMLGDGDCGSNLRKAVQSIQEEKLLDDCSSVEEYFQVLSTRFYSSVGGNMGVIYCSFFNQLYFSFRNYYYPKSFCRSTINEDLKKINLYFILGRMLEEGCKSVMEIGGAKKGDSTFLDAIVPVYQFLLKNSNSGNEKKVKITMEEICEEAKNGFLATKEMDRKRGTKIDSNINKIPDAGAKSVYNILRHLRDYL